MFFKTLTPFSRSRIIYFSFNMKRDVILKPVVRVKFSTDFHGYVIWIKRGFICLMLLMKYLASLKHFWFWSSLHSSWVSIKGQGRSSTLVKGHSDFKVKCLTLACILRWVIQGLMALLFFICSQSSYLRCCLQVIYVVVAIMNIMWYRKYPQHWNFYSILQI